MNHITFDQALFVRLAERGYAERPVQVSDRAAVQAQAVASAPAEPPCKCNLHAGYGDWRLEQVLTLA